MDTVIFFLKDRFLTTTLTGLLSGRSNTEIFSYSSIEDYLFQIEETRPHLVVVDGQLWAPLSLDICESFDTMVERLGIKVLFLTKGEVPINSLPNGASVYQRPLDLTVLKKSIILLLGKDE